MSSLTAQKRKKNACKYCELKLLTFVIAKIKSAAMEYATAE